ELNRDLAGLGLPDPPLVRLTYGLLDARGGELQYACAGHTPPLYLPREGPAALWREFGPMLGAAEARQPARTVALKPGGRVPMFPDGLHGTSPETLAELVAAAEKYRGLSLAALDESLTQDLLAKTPEPDDFTMLGVEFQ